MDTTPVLEKAFWTNKDIMAFTGCSKNTATKIRNEAIKCYGGFTRVLPRKVKRDSVLMALGILKER